MSTQEMQIPRISVERPAGRRFGFALVVAVALVAGGFVGRSTAPTERAQAIVRSATVLSDLGVTSSGDARRAEMHKAMNGITVARVPAIQLDPKSVGSSESLKRAQMYRAMNRLLPQQR